MTDNEIKAMAKYPMPGYVLWYLGLNKTWFFIVELIIFIVGMILTLLEAPRTLIAIPTFTFVGLLLIAAIFHIVAWYMKRKVENKRIEYIKLLEL